MYPRESVTFSIYIPIRQMVGESSSLYLCYCGTEASENASPNLYAQRHAARGDLQGRLTVSIALHEGLEPSRYVWRVDEKTGDALWVGEILADLANTWRSELKEFLSRCLRDALSNPGTPFRAVFTSSAQPYEGD